MSLKKLSLGLILTLPICLMGFNLGYVDGSGVSKKEIRNVATFDSIEIRGSMELTNVEVNSQKPQKLELEADNNLLPLIETTVKDGTLSISHKKQIRQKTKIKAYINVQNLKELKTSGSSFANIKNINNKEFELDISGSSKIIASGLTDKFEVDISGSGNIDAKNLKANKAEIDISGSGKAFVSAKDFLNVKIKGSGDVTYFGNPQIEQKIAGSGSINKGK